MEEIMQAIVTAPAVSWAMASATALAATVAMCAFVSFQHTGSPVGAGIGAVAAAMLLITAMPLLQTAHGTALVAFALVLGLASGLLYFGAYHLMVVRQWKRRIVVVTASCTSRIWRMTCAASPPAAAPLASRYVL